MQKQPDAIFEHLGALGKAQGFSHESAEAGAERGVDTLDVVGGPHVRAGAVLADGQGLGVGRPGIGVARAPGIARRQAADQDAGRGRVALAQGVGHDLAGTPALGQPEPAFAFALAHVGPQLVEF